jgi:hypothetical protein
MWVCGYVGMWGVFERKINIYIIDILCFNIGIPFPEINFSVDTNDDINNNPLLQIIIMHICVSFQSRVRICEYVYVHVCVCVLSVHRRYERGG